MKERLLVQMGMTMSLMNSGLLSTLNPVPRSRTNGAFLEELAGPGWEDRKQWQCKDFDQCGLRNLRCGGI